MRYLVLATDYDGTLAKDGFVDPPTLEALDALRRSGRRALLVTGRELDDLERVFPNLGVFDRVVAENGALLYDPATRKSRRLGEPPSAAFVAALRRAGVDPLSVGASIVATVKPHETTVLQIIRELGLELQVIFNREAVMVLPSGVNKAFGLRAALDELQLSLHNVVGVGDAENDHAFLSVCEAAVAVQNAVPTLKDRADWVTTGAANEGVVELIEAMIANDLSVLAPNLRRHHLTLGEGRGGPYTVDPYGPPLLIAGSSGGGKSTLATTFVEALHAHGYQYCLFDPEGDHDELEGATVVGDARTAPPVAEVAQLLANATGSAVVNLLAVALDDRPAYFAELCAQLHALRARTGRPHWIIVDEAHHVLPAERAVVDTPALHGAHGVLYITVEPEHVAHAALAEVRTILIAGEHPAATLKAFATAHDHPVPELPAQPLDKGEVVAVSGTSVVRFTARPPQSQRRRHLRKYATGQLEDARSFYFRGPEQRLNLRARNLEMFLQMAEGVDEETWEHHLRLGDYSRWFRDAIKDDELAQAAERVEQASGLPPDDARRRIRAAIEERYTAPA